jgi:hypothetical protein
MFTYARCFNGRVQRQQVGLLCNVVDGFDHGANTVAQTAELADFGRRDVDYRANPHH